MDSERQIYNVYNLHKNLLDGPVLWLINLNEKLDERIYRTESFLTTFLNNEPTSVRIVFIKPHQDKKDLELTNDQSIQMDQNLKELKLFLKKTKLNVQAEIEELEVESTHIKDQVDALVQYARNSQASLIVVNNRGHWGLKRLFTGSFSETLIYRSRTPVLVVGSHSEVKSPIKKIFVPTNFTERDHEVFLQAVKYAHQIDAEIDLYHCINDDRSGNLDLDAFRTYEVDGKTVNVYEFLDRTFPEKLCNFS